MTSKAMSFNTAAELYDKVRPDYPAGLYDRLAKRLKLTNNSRILEVGCGTGQATKDLLGISNNLVSLDPGENMLAIARKKFPDVNFAQSTFEDYQDDELFDLIIAATAWHWVDPKLGYKHAHELLKSSGHLVVMRNYHIETDPNAFHIQAQPVYERYYGRSPKGINWMQPYEDEKNQLNNQYFELVDQIEQEWHQEQTIHEYIKLRRTYSDHLAMIKQHRQEFEAALIDFANKKFNGKTTKRYIAAMFIAKPI